MAILQLQPGEVIGGRYQLQRELARGGMGSVWSGRDNKLKRNVAVKLVAPDWGGAQDAQERFEREAMAVARMQSPHVVQIFDYGVERSCPYIVMELLDGEDLRSRLRKLKRVSLEAAAHILVQTAKALSAAHAANIIHRDLKPGNIFLVRSGEEELVKVLDFGVAVSVGDDSDEEVAEGAILGTPQFMSPEQARGVADLDHRTDLWSLGVIIYRALSGRMPFKGGSPTDVVVAICTQPVPLISKLAPDLPSELDAFFLRALARDRDRRFGSAREMALAFSRISPVTFTTLSMPDPGPAIDEAIRAARTAQKRVDDDEQATVELGGRGGVANSDMVRAAIERAKERARRGEEPDDELATMAMDRSSVSGLAGGAKPPPPPRARLISKRVPPPPGSKPAAVPPPQPSSRSSAPPPAPSARRLPPPPGSKPVSTPPPPSRSSAPPPQPSRTSAPPPPSRTSAPPSQPSRLSAAGEVPPPRPSESGDDDEDATLAFERDSLAELPLLTGAMLEDGFEDAYDDEDETPAVLAPLASHPAASHPAASHPTTPIAEDPLLPSTPTTLDPAVAPQPSEEALEEESSLKSNIILVLAAILAGVLIAVVASAIFKDKEPVASETTPEAGQTQAAANRSPATPSSPALDASASDPSGSAEPSATAPSAQPSVSAVARRPSPSPANKPTARPKPNPVSAPKPVPAAPRPRPVPQPPKPEPSDPFAERL